MTFPVVRSVYVTIGAWLNVLPLVGLCAVFARERHMQRREFIGAVADAAIAWHKHGLQIQEARAERRVLSKLPRQSRKMIAATK